jgi:hypothetical protein
MSQVNVPSNTEFLVINGEICQFVMDSPLKKQANEFVELQLKLKAAESEVENLREAVARKFEELTSVVMESRVPPSEPEDGACVTRVWRPGEYPRT